MLGWMKYTRRVVLLSTTSVISKMSPYVPQVSKNRFLCIKTSRSSVQYLYIFNYVYNNFVMRIPLEILMTNWHLITHLEH